MTEEVDQVVGADRQARAAALLDDEGRELLAALRSGRGSLAGHDALSIEIMIPSTHDGNIPGEDGETVFSRTFIGSRGLIEAAICGVDDLARGLRSLGVEPSDMEYQRFEAAAIDVERRRADIAAIDAILLGQPAALAAKLREELVRRVHGVANEAAGAEDSLARDSGAEAVSADPVAAAQSVADRRRIIDVAAIDAILLSQPAALAAELRRQLTGRFLGSDAVPWAWVRLAVDCAAAYLNGYKYGLNGCASEAGRQ